MMYFVSVFISSIVVIVISGYWESIHYNTENLENGRPPNAGVSIAPYIVVPIFFSIVAYQIFKFDNKFDTSNWYIIFVFLGIYLLYALVVLPGKVKKYKLLLEEHINSQQAN